MRRVEGADPGVVAIARALAGDVLMPAAGEVDNSGELPRSHLDALAAAGLFGLVAPPDIGGLGADEPTRLAVIEELATGCLTTTFVWAQHHNAMAAVDLMAPAPVRAMWAGSLSRGAVRAGVAFGALRRPRPAAPRAERTTGGWRISGTAPWVTGWGLVDVVHVAARDTETGDVVWGLVDAVGNESVSAAALDLLAVQASRTVSLAFDRHLLPEDRVTVVEPFGEWVARDRAGLRANGALSLGLAARCDQLLGEPFRAERADVRRQLWTAGVRDVPAARVAATELARRLAAALVVSAGGRGVLDGTESARLARESLFLLVFGQTASIRRTQLTLLGVPDAVAPASPNHGVTAGGL
jgi:alkylation response protein AidB-like acyl-CoA dehydrogenase